ncbi:MAG: glycosyltransferase family 4 protein, partial [Streptosporangiales bacterium]
DAGARRGMTGPPLRILQVTAASAGGDWFLGQVSGLACRGHTVCAVLPADGPLAGRLRAAGIRTEVIPFRGKRPGEIPRIAAAEARLTRLAREFQPDVIHGHLLKAVLCCRGAGLGFPRALRVSQLPGTVHLHSPLLRAADLGTMRLDDLVIGSCQAIASQYRAAGARRVAVSYYGCDVHAINPATPGHAFRHEFGLGPGTPAVGMVAHMYPTRLHAFRDIGVKGHEVFLDAAPLLLRQAPAARLFVVGDEFSGDGSYRRALEARAAALGVAGRVVFTGHRADVAGVLAGLDVVVCPSVSESASYALVEALLMGKGVVASAVGGLPDTVQHGETGLLVPPADPAALAAAMASLLADPGQRAAMGRRGRERCLRQFDISATVAGVEALYRDGLDRLRRAGRPGRLRKQRCPC